MAEQPGKALELRKTKAVVNWQGRNIIITFDDVKRHICPKATDQEVVVFLNMAQSLSLNPWAREIYLIKYSEGEAASYVVAEESYLKAAEQCPEYQGHEAGIIIKDAAGNITQPEGAFSIDLGKDTLLGGWAKVYRKDRDHPFYIAVNFKECAKYTRQGELTRFWDSMPATMIRKVALARALREAFPSRLGGMVTDAEWEEAPSDGKPPMLEKDGKPDWRHFYTKIESDLGLTADQAHKLAGMKSFREALDKGWTMEGIWDLLTEALREQTAAKQTTSSKTDATIEEELFGKDKKETDVGAEPIKPPAPAKPKRDPESIKTISELLRACFEDFKLQPQDVYKELGYSSTQDISKKPADCYCEIAAVRRTKD